MTGAAKTEEEGIQRIYNLDVVRIPTYKPVIRDDMDDMVYRSQEGKFKAVIGDIAERYKGRTAGAGSVRSPSR